MCATVSKHGYNSYPGLPSRVMAKKALVSVGDNTRIVSFETEGSTSEVEALIRAVRVAFQDVLNGREFFLQCKNEDWGGAFIDMVGSDQIADRSVCRVVFRKTEVYIHIVASEQLAITTHFYYKTRFQMQVALCHVVSSQRHQKSQLQPVNRYVHFLWIVGC